MNLYFFPQALKVTFNNKRYLVLFTALALISFALLLYIPIKTVPGNDLPFQLSIMRPKDFTILGSLSLLTALSLTMNIKLLRNKFNTRFVTSAAGQTTTGVASGVAASIFGTASCGSCVGALFSFLGASGVMFLISHRDAIVIFGMVLLILSLYFTSRSLVGVCKVEVKKHEY